MVLFGISVNSSLVLFDLSGVIYRDSILSFNSSFELLDCLVKINMGNKIKVHIIFKIYSNGILTDLWTREVYFCWGIHSSLPFISSVLLILMYGTSWDILH